MKILGALARNHSSFRVFMNLLSTEFAKGTIEGMVRSRDLLRVFLPALDRHEEIEDIVFQKANFPRSSDTSILMRIDEQHEALDHLRQEALALLESIDSRHALAAFSRLPELISSLRHHLETEEEALWPLYRERIDPRCDENLFRLVESRVLALEERLGEDLTVVSS